MKNNVRQSRMFLVIYSGLVSAFLPLVASGDIISPFVSYDQILSNADAVVIADVVSRLPHECQPTFGFHSYYNLRIECGLQGSLCEGTGVVVYLADQRPSIEKGPADGEDHRLTDSQNVERRIIVGGRYLLFLRKDAKPDAAGAIWRLVECSEGTTLPVSPQLALGSLGSKPIKDVIRTVLTDYLSYLEKEYKYTKSYTKFLLDSL